MDENENVDFTVYECPHFQPEGEHDNCDHGMLVDYYAKAMMMLCHECVVMIVVSLGVHYDQEVRRN